MKILLCNDDGIHAPGIAALYEAVRDLGDVRIVAPAAEQSAVGHAITLANPIKAHPVEKNGRPFGFAVGGTPADCVKLSGELLPGFRPDLVVSGINLGPNTGISVIYSGTVSAATEGLILGYPSIAVSLNTFQHPLWESASHFARLVVETVIRQGLPPDTLLNVNLPNLPPDQVRGFRLTRMGRSRFVEEFDRRTDPRGNTYFWMGGKMELLGDGEGTDVAAVEAGYVSCTPISFDLTHRTALPALGAWPMFKGA